jgi:hypothetical protein
LTVWLLWHENDDDWKFLGAFSSREFAESTKEDYLKLPGFCDCPDGFTIDLCEVDKREWTTGYIVVY